MSRPDKAVEPSMEEILASIRKIISEEPIGSRPGPSDAQAPADALGRYQPSVEPSFYGPSSTFAPRGPRMPDAASADEMLDTARGNGSPKPSDSAGDGDRSLAKPAGGTEPHFSAAAGDAWTAPARDADLNGHAAATEARGTSPDKPLDDTRRTERPDVDADAGLRQARARIERHLGAAATGSGIERSLLPGVKSIRDADFRGDRQEGPGRFGAGGLMARVAAASGQAEPSAKDQTAAATPAKVAGQSDEPANATSKVAEAVPKATDGPAAPTSDVAKAPEAEPAVNSAAREKAEAATAAVEASPAESPPLATEEAAPANGRTRALEDAVAEMLRPMLREWLDANLPRLACEVLREEMAKSPLPGNETQAE